MHNTKKFDLTQMLLLCATIGLLALSALPAQAQLTNLAAAGYQTGQPNFAYNDTNWVQFALTNSQTITNAPGGTNTYIKTIRQNQGVTLFLAVWSTNAAIPSSTTTNYTVKFDVTADGFTWTKGNGGYPITWTVPLVGNTAAFTNVFWTNIPATTLSNIRKMQCTQASTTCGTNVNAALLYSQSTQ
jgi:hypothetical protein